MKNVILLFFVCVSFIGYSQQKLSKELSDFSELKVFDKIKVTLIQAEWNRVDISGIQRDQITIVEDNNVLKIKMALHNLWDEDNKTQVFVYYKKLKTIDANEGSKVITEGTITEDFLNLRVQEGATIVGSIEAKRIVVRAVTGGELILKGTVAEQEVVVKAGGQYLGEELITESTEVKISAGGRANVYASKYVKAVTAAGGTIKIFGKPKKIDSKKVFGGKIIEVN